MEQKTSKLWGCGGRFARQMNDNLAQLNNSLLIDKRLVQEDIFGSFAYSKSLCQAQIIQPNELEMIQSALYEISNEWKNGTVVLKDDDEDIHSANERLLIEKIGNVGRKIHTGRSRNDQVILDMKLWIKKAISDILEIFSTFLNVIIEKAEENIDILLPGYTHLQRAQPIRVSHWLLSYGFFFQADCERLKQIFERVNLSMPLGSGAISGNPFEIDRIELAKNLNFRGVTMNSMNAVSDRDFVCEFNFVASMISIHLSRLSEDLILYSTKEFNYIKLSNEFCTGSSLMPQKFNADSIELVRGTTGSIIGQLMNILTTLKGLPSTYNKDLQGDKESMFYVYDKIILSLKVMVGVIDTLEIFKENCWNALSYDMLATDLAYYLVRKGKAFRDAHHCASAVVDVASKSGIDINKLPLTAFKMVSESFNEDVYNIFSFEKSVEQYQIIGGTSKTSVLEQIAHLKEFAANLKC